MDVLNGPGEHVGNIQELDLAAGGVVALGNGVQEYHFLDGAVLNTLVSRAGQNTVGGAGVNRLGTAVFGQGSGSVAQRTGGIYHVVKQDAGLAPYIADDVHYFAHIGFLTALVHNGQTHVHLGGEGTGAANGANIGGDNNEIIVVVLLLRELCEVVIHKGRIAQQMVQGDVEEALDLGGVEIHGQNTISTGGGDHVGNQLGRDGVTALGLAVLTGIAKVGDNSGDSSGGSTAAGVAHDQQFHQMVVYGLAGGLNQENVGAPDGFQKADGCLTVGKGLDLRLAEVNPQILADVLGKFRIGVAAENLDVLSVRNHQ